MGIGTEEHIHTSSAHDKLLCLRTTHVNKKIKLIMAPRVIDSDNKNEQEQVKFEQMRPILASASIADHLLLKNIPIPTTRNTSSKLSLIVNKSNIISSDTSPSSDFFLDPAGPIIPTISVLVHSSSQPSTTPNIHDCFSSSRYPLRSF